ncbi:MAG: LysM peptidoglycan-binding domain-containing protein [Chloroflexota bacterium]
MNLLKQGLMGILLALVSVFLIIGSMVLSFSEGQTTTAMRATPADTIGPQFMLTPGRPTFTPGMTQIAPPHQTSSVVAMPTACPPPMGWTSVTVQAGDSLESLAQRYRVTVAELTSANCLLTDTLLPGAILYVPATQPTETAVSCGPYPGWVFYTVQSGDTLFHISMLFGTTTAELKYANCLVSDTIYVGQKLYVPNRPLVTIPPTVTPRPSATVTEAASPTATSTGTLPPTLTETPKPSATVTYTPTATDTQEPFTLTPTSTPLPPSPTATPTATHTPSLTIPADTPTASATVSPTLTPTVPETPTATTAP